MTFALVGHRGAMAELTENTVESFTLAERLGVDEVETDVRISADGQLFMLHDKTLDRVAANEVDHGLGPTAELPWERIAAVELRGGLRVPTLAQTYDVTDGTIQLEIKAPAALAALPAFFAERPADAARTMITSFSAAVITEASALLPTVARGIITFTWRDVEQHPGGPAGLMTETGSNRLHTGFEGLRSADVDRCHDAGWPVHVWPLRTEDDLRRGLALGADGMTADDPRTAAAWLAPLLSGASTPPGSDTSDRSD